jgi:hypothetical protein
VKYDAEREEEEQYDIKMKEVYKVEEFHKGKEEYGQIQIDCFSLLTNYLL